MIKHNKNDYSSELIVGLLIFSLVSMPCSSLATQGHDGVVAAQTDNQEDISDSPRNDRVLDDRATKTIFKISQNLPSILNYSPIARKTAAVPLPQDASGVPGVAPIIIEADKLSYNDATGDILAYGKVIITRDGVKIETEELNGNTKTSQVWTKEPLLFTDKQARIVTNDIFYDYNQKTGQAGETKGKINRQFVAGKHIDIQPEMYIVTQATATGCPAQIPDYHISAEKIEIWPDDKMIIHKPKFLIRNHVIFSMNKYETSLKKADADKTPFPRIGYRKSDGIYIEQHLAYPISNTTNLFADLNYYSKWNFRPSFGIQDNQRNYTTQIVAGYFADGDNHWIKKYPEFSWHYHPHRIGDSAFSYHLGISYGRWLGNNKTSWHQNYSLYLNHDPISFGEKTFLYLGGGIAHVRESYDKSRQNISMFDVTLTQDFSRNLKAWASYHYMKHDNQPIFSYSIPDISQEINYGFTYKVDRLNTIGVTYRYDQNNHSLKDVYYTWYRNLHCWDSVLTYKSKARSWEWTMNVVHW